MKCPKTFQLMPVYLNEGCTIVGAYKIDMASPDCIRDRCQLWHKCKEPETPKPRITQDSWYKGKSLLDRVRREEAELCCGNGCTTEYFDMEPGNGR